MANYLNGQQQQEEEYRRLLRQGQAGIPNNTVPNANQYLQNQNGRSYAQNYGGALQGILSQIRSGQQFQYDARTDPLYNIYKDLYTQNGRRAMQDTMGQAAALTGGYGNSYAQSVGQQQYGQYMENLNAMVPQLQQQAYQQYSDLLSFDQAERQAQDQLALQYAQLQHEKAKLDWEKEKKKGSGTVYVKGGKGGEGEELEDPYKGTIWEGLVWDPGYKRELDLQQEQIEGREGTDWKDILDEKLGKRVKKKTRVPGYNPELK